ncbi:galactose-3-O-sulfotransferase 3-like isoform X2 [Paramormyrops kingsleyae]|nr:galactose-3-O-sulfotransferase 3-like isoform X2 [Paramormyrops kingsleyae]XP_023649028.1 galactose-3-O-sulfotransferase 3-like isoform X2 [Paramormyrops kingsleyae]
MSQKKIFLLLVAISSALLLRHGGHVSWTMRPFHLGYSSLQSSSASGLKTKHTSIAFLKTHKTASTTVQNLLFRFAERNNLTVALPIQACDHQFCYPRTFSTRFVHSHTMSPQVITSHMRFNHSELRRLMPNDTVYITILREPTSMFESLFSYYNQYCLSFKRVPNGSLEAFLEQPWHYYRPHEKDSMYARNTLTFDLGGDKDRSPKDKAYIKGFIGEVERIFSLVMIAEHFDESLVLLRHLLAWDLEDMLYVRMNMRRPSSRRSLGADLPARIRSWNALDTALYEHFNKSLWERLRALGLSSVGREVHLLQSAQVRLVQGCFGGRLPQLRPAAFIRNKELRPWQPSPKVDIMGYDLPPNASRLGRGAGAMSHDLCVKLLMPEVQYSRLLLRSQSQRYRRSHSLWVPPPERPILAHAHSTVRSPLTLPSPTLSSQATDARRQAGAVPQVLHKELL